MARTSADYPGFPADLTPEYDATVARISEVEAQIDALATELSTLRQQRRAALDLYAETIEHPATLLDLTSLSNVAHRKVAAAVKTLHPRLYDYEKPIITNWLDVDENGHPNNKPVQIVAARVSLMRKDGREVSAQDSHALAAALIEFAHTYTPNPIGLLPEVGLGDHTGMVQAVFTTENSDSPTIWYTPDGTHAAYYTDTHNGLTGYMEPATGTLVEMLHRVIRDANSRDIEDDEHDW